MSHAKTQEEMDAQYLFLYLRVDKRQLVAKWEAGDIYMLILMVMARYPTVQYTG